MDKYSLQNLISPPSRQLQDNYKVAIDFDQLIIILLFIYNIYCFKLIIMIMLCVCAH